MYRFQCELMVNQMGKKPVPDPHCPKMSSNKDSFNSSLDQVNPTLLISQILVCLLSKSLAQNGCS